MARAQMATDDEDDYKATTQPQGPLPQLEPLFFKNTWGTTVLQEHMGDHCLWKNSWGIMMESLYAAAAAGAGCHRGGFLRAGRAWRL